MLTVIGWTIAAILFLAIAFVAIGVWLTPSDPAGIAALGRDVMARTDADMRQLFARNARERQLASMKRDIAHARRLMDLEAEACGLQARYARNGANGRTCSPDVEVALHGIFDEIETLKRGAVS